VDDGVRSLINPRQSAPISYDTSPLNREDRAPEAGPAAAPGQPAPDVLLQDGDKPQYLTASFGAGFVALAIAPDPALSAALDTLAADTQNAPHPLRVLHTGDDGLADPHGQLAARYGNQTGSVYLLRPDGYVLGRWIAPAAGELRAALAPYYPSLNLNATQKGQA